jgi:hypothetical protein
MGDVASPQMLVRQRRLCTSDVTPRVVHYVWRGHRDGPAAPPPPRLHRSRRFRVECRGGGQHLASVDDHLRERR